MPKSTFYNLPIERRLLIASVALDEFSRHPFYEASVATIIERLSIARGTYYKYFTDLKEMFLYLYCETHLDEDEVLEEALRQKKKMRKAYQFYFDVMLEELFDELHDYRRMVRLSMNALLKKEIKQYRTEVLKQDRVESEHYSVKTLTEQVLLRGLQEGKTKQELSRHFGELLVKYETR